MLDRLLPFHHRDLVTQFEISLLIRQFRPSESGREDRQRCPVALTPFILVLLRQGCSEVLLLGGLQKSLCFHFYRFLASRESFLQLFFPFFLVV